MTASPLLAFAKAGGLPPFRAIDASHVDDAMATLLAELESGLSALEAKLTGGDASYDDVVEALADLTEPMERAWGVVSHLMGVRNAPALREAQQRNQPKVVQAMMRLAQSEPVTAALDAIKRSPRYASLSPARQRIVDARLLDAKLSGFGLSGDVKARFNAIQEELSELATRFSNNVLDATKAWSLMLTSAADVDGLPDSWRAMAAAAAREHAGDNADARTASAERGPWRLSLDFPSFQPFMRYATKRELRERLYKAYLTRASELDGGTNDNRPLISRILELRDEKAKLLGYRSYAEVSLAQKMAPSVSEVHRLLDELRSMALPVAREELKELVRLAEADGITDVRHWDLEHYAEKLRVLRYDFSEEELRQYLPFPQVLRGLFGVCERLFGVAFEEATADVERWHDDVVYYRVTRDGREIASFFLDPYARPADKRGGA